MRRPRLAVPLLLVVAAGAGGAAQSPLERALYDRAPVAYRPIETIAPNRGPVSLPLYGGGGPLDRHASDRATGYALIALPLRADVPLLVLLDHDWRARVRARVLDRPPWADPRASVSVTLESRRGERGGRRLAGAWLLLPDGEPPRDAFLLVEASVGPLRVELFDPVLPPPYASSVDRWERGTADDLASPIEADAWRGAQRLWPWPDPSDR